MEAVRMELAKSSTSSLGLALVSVVLSVVAAAVLAAGNIVTAVVVAIFAVLLAFVAVSSTHLRLEALICMAFTAFAAPLFVFVPPDSTNLSIAFRLSGLVLVSLTLSGGALATRSNWATTVRAWLFVAPIGIFILCATLPHGQWTDLMTYSLGAALLAITLILIGRLPRPLVARAIWVTLFLTTISSLVTGAAIPSVGMQGGRLRGIFENANSFGFFAFLLIVGTILTRPRSWMSALAVVAGFAAILFSASRASALAALIFVAGWLFSRRPIATVVGLLLIGAAVAGILALVSPPDLAILRDNDSRSNSFTVAIAEGMSSPVIGIGLSNESVEIASSPLRAFSNAGLIGLVAILLLWIFLVCSTFKSGAGATWFALAAIVHSAFEGWLLSPISPLLVVFAALWWSVTRARTAEKSNTGTISPSGALSGSRTHLKVGQRGPVPGDAAR